MATKTEAEKKAIRSEAAKKAAQTRRANKIAAERREEETNHSVMSWLPWVLAAFVIAMLIWHPWTGTPSTPIVTPTASSVVNSLVETPVIPTEEPTPVPTEAPVVTEVPTEPVATEAPVVTEAPVTPIVACETIEVSKDGGLTWENAGLSLETESVYDIGNRVTWTSRATLIDKAPNEKLTDAELKIVENTWLKVRLNACDTNVVVFTHGIKIGDLKFNKGALFQLSGGYQEFDIRNGEIVLWFDQVHQDKDMIRIIDQIRHGNFDIKSRLGLAVTDSLKDKLPDDILVGVQIVLLPK